LILLVWPGAEARGPQLPARRSKKVCTAVGRGIVTQIGEKAMSYRIAKGVAGGGNRAYTGIGLGFKLFVLLFFAFEVDAGLSGGVVNEGLWHRATDSTDFRS